MFVHCPKKKQILPPCGSCFQPIAISIWALNWINRMSHKFVQLRSVCRWQSKCKSTYRSGFYKTFIPSHYIKGLWFSNFERFVSTNCSTVNLSNVSLWLEYCCVSPSQTYLHSSWDDAKNTDTFFVKYRDNSIMFYSAENLYGVRVSCSDFQIWVICKPLDIKKQNMYNV